MKGEEMKPYTDCVVMFCGPHDEGNAHPFNHVHTVCLVTDDWHMPRAHAMLVGELGKRLTRKIRVMAGAVTNGPKPPQSVLEREVRGLEAYLSGTYGQVPMGQHFGKPAFETTNASP